MVLKDVSAGLAYRVKLVIRQPFAEMASGCGEGIVKLIIGVIHLIDLEGCFKAAFVEPGVVRDERETLDEWLHLLPDMLEAWRVISVAWAETMHTLAEPAIVVWFRMYQAVETIYDLSVADDDHSH